jgi:hypothetical protein
MTRVLNSLTPSKHFIITRIIIQRAPHNHVALHKKNLGNCKK